MMETVAVKRTLEMQEHHERLSYGSIFSRSRKIELENDWQSQDLVTVSDSETALQK